MKRVVNWSNVPVALTPRDLPKFLPIGTNQAYELCHKVGFPVKKIGKKYVISRDAFKTWLEGNG